MIKANYNKVKRQASECNFVTCQELISFPNELSIQCWGDAEQWNDKKYKGQNC